MTKTSPNYDLLIEDELFVIRWRKPTVAACDQLERAIATPSSAPSCSTSP